MVAEDYDYAFDDEMYAEDWDDYPAPRGWVMLRASAGSAVVRSFSMPARIARSRADSVAGSSGPGLNGVVMTRGLSVRRTATADQTSRHTPHEL